MSMHTKLNICALIKQATFPHWRNLSETRWQIHLPRKQCLINWKDIDTQLMKAWTAIDKLSVIWKSDPTDKMKRRFLPISSRVNTAVWMHHLDANKTAQKAKRQLHKDVVSNIKQVLATTPHKAPTIQPPAPITKIIQVRRTRHAGHCWRSRDKVISDVLYGPPLMAEQKQDDQLEPTYNSYVKIQDVVQKTCRRRWTIEKSGERGSGISVQVARHDNDEIRWIPSVDANLLSDQIRPWSYLRHLNNILSIVDGCQELSWDTLGCNNVINLDLAKWQPQTTYLKSIFQEKYLSTNVNYFRRHSWCNGYHSRKMDTMTTSNYKWGHFYFI